MGFANRTDAGDRLAHALSGWVGRSDVVVLGLVRGGVPVAARVAAALGAPLDVLVVRKLGVPWSPELAFGAVGAGGVVVHNPEVADYLTAQQLTTVTEAESAEVARRERRYRADRPALDLIGRNVILVDDGLATGATARAAIAVARAGGAAWVVLAVPVAAADSLAALRASAHGNPSGEEADEVVCPSTPATFGAVSEFYDDFPQTTDDEVSALLAQAGRPA